MLRLIHGNTPRALPISLARSGRKMPDCDDPVPVELFEGQRDVHPSATPMGLGVIWVPCRKCAACLRLRRRMWYARMMRESELAVRTWFLSLTYARGDRQGEYDEVQRFLKRLRKRFPKGALRYVAVLERGEQNGRLHWHMLLHCYCHVTKRQIQGEWQRAGFSGCKLARPDNVGYLAHYSASAMLGVHASVGMVPLWGGKGSRGKGRGAPLPSPLASGTK